MQTGQYCCVYVLEDTLPVELLSLRFFLLLTGKEQSWVVSRNKNITQK